MTDDTYRLDSILYVKLSKPTVHRVYDPVVKRYCKGSSGKSSWSTKSGAVQVLNHLKARSNDIGYQPWRSLPLEVTDRLVVVEFGTNDPIVV